MMCGVAVAAGAIVGWVELEDQRTHVSDVKDVTPALPGPERGKVKTSTPSAPQGAPEPLPTGTSAPGKGQDIEGSVETPGGAVSPEAAAALKAELEEVSSRIQKQEFRSAGELALDLARRADAGPVRSEALRLAAKSRVFQKLLESVPSPPPAEALCEVILSNGNKIAAKEVEEQADRYVIKFATGGTFAPRKEEVLEIRRNSPQGKAESEWKSLQSRISRLDHPIDMYLDGVQRCYQLGRKREGLEILEKLLPKQESDQIPLLFIADADAAVLRDWRVAAGREAPKAPQGAATSGGETLVSVSGKREPQADEGVVEQPESRSPADPGQLVRAAQLVAEAQTLYQGAAGKEGKEGDLSAARERLDRAVDILELLPPDDESVRSLRIQLAQLLSDVVRASPF